MKNSTLTILFVALFSISAIASASKVYPGYVILNDNSRMEGAITMLGAALNEVKVKFTSKDGKKTIYKAKEVIEYGFNVEVWNDETRKNETNTIIYTRQTVERSAVAFGSKEVLLERQLTGTINMYNHFIERNIDVNQPFTHIVYLEKERGSLIPINKKNFKIVLKRMTKDYPELNAKIGTRGHGYKRIIEIIDTYNNWMSENGEEVVLGMQ